MKQSCFKKKITDYENMKQLNETVEKSLTPNFPCYTCMVVLQSVTKLCPGVTVVCSALGLCTHTKSASEQRRDKVERRLGKSKLKVTSVAEGSREKCCVSYRWGET